jgi:chitin synthase
MILMNFISRVNYNDPFSPLDYDMFRKIQVLCGVTADYFELVSQLEPIFPERS